MKFYVNVNKENLVLSTMVSHDIDEEYMRNNNIVQISDTDYHNIDRLMVDHDIFITEGNKISAYQRLDHGLALAKQQINSYVTEYIAYGFYYKGRRYKASVYDQVNITNKLNFGGRYKTGDGEIVDLNATQANEIHRVMVCFIDFVMIVHWQAKEKLEKAETFEEMDSIVNEAKSMLDTMRVTQGTDFPMLPPSV